MIAYILHKIIWGDINMDEHWPQVMVFAQCNEKGYEERRGGTPVIE